MKMEMKMHRFVEEKMAKAAPVPCDFILGDTLGKAELKGRTFGDTEFVIGHSGSTVPERSGVALSFCGRLQYFFGQVTLEQLERNQETFLMEMKLSRDETGSQNNDIINGFVKN